MTCDVVFVSNNAFVTYITLWTFFNTFLLSVLRMYIVVQRFLYYSHFPDRRHNIDISILWWHLITKDFASIHRHLRLITANLTSLANTSTPGLKQSMTYNRASLAVAFAVAILVLPRENYSCYYMYVDRVQNKRAPQLSIMSVKR